jgi:hypothetical protein
MVMKSTTELVEITADLFQRPLDDAAVVSQLIALSETEATAWRLVVFLPMAFIRVMFAPRGVAFSDVFQINDESPPRILAEEPIFAEALAFAQRFETKEKHRDYWIMVAGRGAEFDGINTLLNGGSRLEDIRLGTPLISLPPNLPR